MLRKVKTEVFYPYPPQQVWQVLTNRRALAAWLMDNDFEPRVGHKFQFQAHSLPGLDGMIHCQVLELDEPKRLAYTWQDSLMCQRSIVTWTLTPVDGGTRLQLEHRELRHEVVETLPTTAVNQPRTSAYTWHGQFMYESSAVTQTLVLGDRNIPSIPTPCAFGADGWDYCLNQKLPQILMLAADS